MPIKLYNTLARKKEEFQPLKDKQAGIYTCGPTVYDFAHIGNLRSFIFADILQRALKYNGYKLTWVMNITDVDDKTIKGSQEKYPKLEPREALLKFTKEYGKIFWQDLKKLNIKKPDKIPLATEFIPQMQELIVKIMKTGYGYEKDGSFYFDVKKYSQNYKYGQLVKLDLGQLKTGTRALSDEYEKEDLQDFVLWKAARENEPSWDFKYRDKNYPGRPGWHIECSAMSNEYLGTPFDIHTGGIDLQFPHHENEVAQSVTGYGAKKLANFFLHNEHVLVDGHKMAKRFKNFYTLKDLEGKNIKPIASLSVIAPQLNNPLAYRYLCLNTHYRSKMNFTWQGLEAAQSALENLCDEYQNLLERNPPQPPFEKGGSKRIREKYRQRFLDAVNDDLNTPQTLAVMWEMIKDENLPDEEKKTLLLDFDKIFGLGLDKIKPIEIPEEIKKLAAQREQLRQDKKWQEADEIRKEIEKDGYQIEDTESGPEIKKT